MKNILLTIEYDGSDFAGWQKQPGRRTVQGELEHALGELCGQTVALEGASRTDAGVHAFGQQATLQGTFGIPTERIPAAANGLLAVGRPGRRDLTAPFGDLRIAAACEKPAGFHARFSAAGKTYRYRIRNTVQPDIFQRNYCYQINRCLNTAAMRTASEQLIGEHDFRAFMSAGGNGSYEGQSTVRTIYDIDLDIKTLHPTPCETPFNPCEINLTITGNGFLYNMVRIIAGTLTEVGLGRIDPAAVTGILTAGDRTRAGHTAPPQGLYLVKVHYPSEKGE